MPIARIILLTVLTLLAFTGNSLLCRAALLHTQIDAASFTSIRLLSGVMVLLPISLLKRKHAKAEGNWLSASALFVYAAGFSYAYTRVSAATGALLLFGAVQITMMGYGIWKGERLKHLQSLGLALAHAGMAWLLFPGLSAPPIYAAACMLMAGIAWGVYSLRGKGVMDPIHASSGNFMRAMLIALLFSLLSMSRQHFDATGALYAIASGAIASGVGYVIWYTVLPFLKATHAAIVQLSVPMMAALGGVVLLNEVLSLRLVLASITILGGIALVMFDKKDSLN